MTVSYWIIKQNPALYSWNELVSDKVTPWNGARTREAKESLLELKKGDQALYYHAGSEKVIVGIVTVARKAYSADDSPAPKGLAINLKPVAPLGIPVTIKSLQEEPSLGKIASLLTSRATVVPISKKNFDSIVEKGDITRLLQQSVKSSRKPANKK